MLNQLEKKEMLKDARSAKRRARFRKMLVKDSTQSLDAYLKFLKSIEKVFSQGTSAPLKPSQKKFKL